MCAGRWTPLAKHRHDTTSVAVPVNFTGHRAARQCYHGSRHITREEEEQTPEEVSDKQSVRQLRPGRGDPDTNAAKRTPKRHWASASGVGDSHTRYAATVPIDMYYCPCLLKQRCFLSLWICSNVIRGKPYVNVIASLILDLTLSFSILSPCSKFVITRDPRSVPSYHQHVLQ